jgi:hypothetical protein
MLSVNMHPANGHKWNNIDVKVFGSDGGDCLNLYLDRYQIYIHYGDSGNRFEFLSRLKEVIAALENHCPTCGK